MGGVGGRKDDMCGSHYNMFKAAGRSTKETGERDGVVPPPPVKKRGRGRPPKAAKPDTFVYCCSTCVESEKFLAVLRSVLLTSKSIFILDKAQVVATRFRHR